MERPQLSPEKLRLADELFDAAMDLDPAARRKLLEVRCGDDPELRGFVEKLLADASDELEILDRGAGPDGIQRDVSGAPLTTPCSPHQEPAPRWVGPYRLLEPLGRGGMGEVWLAEQREPIRRRVALKLVRSTVASREVLTRFEVERQALALMEDPRIARILDAGLTEDGAPYFVMEHVPGPSIVEYCQRSGISTDDRIRLLRNVAIGVQHAHQKGIIHRDLKPANVLVVDTDDGPLPKIIDFGIAKAMHRSLTDDTLHTQLGRLVGTPEYISPERADRPFEIDTRSDVYSLGVILYELLCGVRPFDLSNRPVAYSEIHRTIRETEPTPPSVRLRETTQESATTTDTEPPLRLSRSLAPELDWITLHALEKDPDRRYPTAQALADDLQAYLDGMPVAARRPTMTYRLRKLARRHWLAVGAATLTLGITLLGAVVSTVGWVRALRAERAAALEAEKTRRVTGFMMQLFEVSDPSQARGNSVTAREILDRGAHRVRDNLDDQPAVQFELLATIARVYLDLGLTEESQELLEVAVEMGRGHAEIAAGDLATAINLLGEAQYARGHTDEAEELIREALHIRQEELGRSHPDVAESLNNIGAVLRRRGDVDGAERSYREALEIRRSQLGERDPSYAQSVNNLAVLLHENGDLDEAEGLYRSTLALRTQVLGADHPDTINSMHNLGVLLSGRDQPNEAERLLRGCLRLRREILGDEHPETIEAIDSLADLLAKQQRSGQAEDLMRESLRLRRQVWGDSSYHAGGGHHRLGRFLSDAGRWTEAAQELERAVAALSAARPDDTAKIARWRGELGLALLESGRPGEARDELLAAERVLVGTSSGTLDAIRAGLRRLDDPTLR